MVTRVIRRRDGHSAEVDSRWWDIASSTLLIPSAIVGRIFKIGINVKDINGSEIKLYLLVSMRTRLLFPFNSPTVLWYGWTMQCCC